MAKKKQTAARTTISVPSELKRRMDAITENVNWSAIACEAFQAKLSELTTKREAGTMQEVIERFRQMKRAEESSDYHNGEADGRKWAMNAASIEQLENLEELHAGHPGNQWEVWFAQDEAWKKLATVIDPKIKRNRDFLAFWHAIRSYKGQSPDYYRGFADAALDVWDEVKTQL